MNKYLRIFAVGALLWLAFILPPATLLALLNNAPFYALWFISMLWIPVPLIILFSVFRSKSAIFRWWAFQYLGLSAIGFSAAGAGALLSLFVERASAGIIAIMLFVVFCAVAVRAAHRIHLVPLKINSSKITKPIRLVQISDVHIGSRKPAFLDKVVALVNSQKPDALLITGDLIDENVAAESLRSLSDARCQIFYCSGNHERYVDYQSALNNIGNQGVSVLSDRVEIFNELLILGVEDRQHVKQAEAALESVLAGESASGDFFSVLLYHQPDLWAAAISQRIDLMLSGHTHKGQIWPFGWLVRSRYKHVSGHFQSAMCHLFVSQGTGTWGPVLRFGTRCEVTVIDLQPA